MLSVPSNSSLLHSSPLFFLTSPIMNQLSIIIVLLCSLQFSSLISSHNSQKMMIKLPSCDYSAIYNFGDSNSDTGGIAAAFGPQTAPYPYGQTYFNGSSGRNSDGRLVIDFLADHLGLPYLSPYLKSVGSNYRHGTNFATGGATVMQPNKSWFDGRISPFNFEIQVDQFALFKEKTAHFYNQDKEECLRKMLPNPEDFSTALFTLDIGQNDVAPGLLDASFEALPEAISNIISQFTIQVKKLYELGARTFWIHNTGPAGCMPLYRNKERNHIVDDHGCLKSLNYIALEFNKQLKNAVLKLRSELSEAALVYVDMYRAKYELITNANNQGFEDPFRICCGDHGTGHDVWCGEKVELNGNEVFGDSCEDPSKVISWDGVHYTEAANHWLAKRISNGSLSDPPVGIAEACNKQTRMIL